MSRTFQEIAQEQAATIERLNEFGHKCRDEIEELRASVAWLSDRLHDAVNTCYGGTDHAEIEAHIPQTRLDHADLNR